MIWKGDNTWFFGLVGQRAIGDLIQYLYIFLYYFFQISICSIPKALARFKFASALLHFNLTFYRVLNSGLSCTCTDSRIFNAPNFAQNTFLCKSVVQVDRTLMPLFFWQAPFFPQKSLCWERKWWGGVKDKDLTDFALIKLPPNSQFSLPSLEHGYEPFMRWPSYIIVVLPVDLVFRRVMISIINQRKWMFLWIWLL